MTAPNSENNTTDSTNNGKKDKLTLHDHIVIWSPFGAAIIALFACIGVGVQIHYSNINNNKVIQRMDSAMQVDNRAYITIATGTISRVRNADSKKLAEILYSVQISNQGKTPAYHVRGEFNIDVLDSGKEPTFNFPLSVTSNTSANFIMAANTTITFKNYKTFDFKDTIEIQKGKKNIFIWGNVYYDDIFFIHRIVHMESKFDASIYPCFSGNANCSYYGENYEQIVPFEPHIIIKQLY